MLSILGSDILSISNHWFLRNDRVYLVLYKITNNESVSLPLSPPVAVFVALLGERVPFSKLVTDVNYALGLDSIARATDFINLAIKNLNRDKQIIVKNEPPNKVLHFEPAKYFIPFDKYRLPQDGRLNRPTHIRFSSASYCQTACLYCYAERKKISKRKNLPVERWIELVDEAIANEILNVEIGGADPFADQVSPSIAAHVLRSGRSVFLSTKAAINAHILDQLIESGLNSTETPVPSTIQMSIDATVPEIADRLTGTKGYMERADANVKLCLSRGVRVRIKSVLTIFNHAEILPILKKYTAIGVRFFQFVQCGYSHFRDTSRLLLDASQKSAIIEISESLRCEDFPGLEIVIQAEEGTGTASLTPEVWAKRSRCTGGYSSMTICQGGDVILCEQMPTTAKYIVGNVQKASLLSVWTSDNLKKWLQPPIEAFSGTPCFTCEDFKGCVHQAGWCYRDALFAYGKMHTAVPRCPKQLAPARRLL